MSALIVTDLVKAACAALTRFAEEHPLTLADLQRLAMGTAAPPGDDARRTLHVPANYRVVFTLEDHPRRDGGTQRLRHLSVSLDGVKKGRVPPAQALRFLLPLFGFTLDLDRCHVYAEDVGDRVAANVIGL